MTSHAARTAPSWLIALVCVAVPAAALAAPPADVERKVDELLARMTIEEKVGQLQQLDGDPNTGQARDEQRTLARQGRLGSLLNVRGARNVNAIQKVAVEESRLKVPLLLGFDVISGYRIVFPIPLAEASSFDPSTAKRAGQVAAAEAAAAGVKWTFAPMVDLARDPRWGRIAEGAGEDPYLGAALARAWVLGFQGDDPSSPDRIMACVKHWVAYGAAEGGRDYAGAEVSERTLRTMYFPPFHAAIEAGAGTLMTAFNDIDGVPATANPFTLTKVLRGEWRFDGLVVSDYTAVRELIPHGVAASESDAARLAFNAGTDMEMVSRLYSEHLPRLIVEGKVPVSRLDEAVRRILRVKFRLGLFDGPYADEARERATVGRREHRAVAREVAARTLVLLKNDRGVLPLGAQVRSVAVIGPLADDRDAPLGHWRGDGRRDDVTTLLSALQERTQDGAKLTVTHAQGTTIEGDSTAGFEAAVKAARGADVAIVALGESAEMSGEAASRSMLDLPGRQLDLLKAVHATGTPTVLVLFNGRPLTIPWAAEHVPAILEAWLPGTEGGHAIADVLFGDVNPGGKLPVTFPRSVGQVPIYYNHRSTGRPPTADKYTSKYIDLPVGPLFPFGHGLSYSRFRLSGLRLSRTEIPADGALDVDVDLENADDRAGDEVVQLYLRDLVASVARPVKELRGFQRLTLGPREKTTVHFTLLPESLGFYDERMRFVVEPGEFLITVGTSSVGGLESRFTVTGSAPSKR